MGVPVLKPRLFGDAEMRTLQGLRDVLDAQGVPNDGGRFIDKTGGLRMGHQHGHPGCEDYRKAFPE